MNAPDLTQRPPHSPRVRLGGYTILPRVLAQARAMCTGRAGEYQFNQPLDHVLFGFAGVTAEAFIAQAKTGAGDFEILQWFNAQAKKAPHEIAAWSTRTQTFVESDVETRQWLAGRIQEMDTRRDDIHALFDDPDFDDYLSFGGCT